ncbi:MAG: glutamine-hydrolyzing GMP synthase [Bacteroidota bacterium]
MQETILILDFGSQYTQLIARKVRELNVYCEIHPYNSIPEISSSIKGVILSGSPFSVRDDNALQPDLSCIKGKVPVLGICYGAQLIAKEGGGEVLQSKTREYGRANLSDIEQSNELFKGINKGSQVWMSHGDTIVKLPDGFKVIASTGDVEVAAYDLTPGPSPSGEGKLSANYNTKTYGIQFHPEVYHTTDGMILLRNFLVDICGCSQDWTPGSFVETKVSELRQMLGTDKVVLGISGGVDSTVAAVLLDKAIGNQLFCIFVDNGLLRKNEFESVLRQYKRIGLNVRGVDAKERFYKELAGATDPERKRKIIGKGFIDVFNEEANRIENVKWLAQGTIYPDVIESVSVKGPSATIKSHHNVGGLPEIMKLQVIEPLKSLFKDEVRRVGEALGIDSDILGRHPFPGPGLGVRILGEITLEKVRILQEVDHIYIEGLKSAGLYDDIWQAGSILLPVQSVGVMGDERTYESVVCLRAVSSTDGMTADWCHLPNDFLSKISNEIINKVKGINRVVYDISSKPPATIEWE